MEREATKKKVLSRLRVSRVEVPTYIVDESSLGRYDQQNLIFNRIYQDPDWAGYMRTEEKQGMKNIARGEEGYTRIDYSLAEAAWTIHDVWVEAFNWNRLSRPRGPSLMGDKWYRNRYEFKDPNEATSQLKRTARFYGASLVGVTELNNRWLYANKRFDLETLELPESAKYAVVMAIEMDKEAIAMSPACSAAAATGICYSKMAFVTSSLAEFIRNLGYTAIPAGNDTALSIPLAIDAGLGQMGRNGLLITPEYGPRVRLCKVLTDLPLVQDNPIDFGVIDFCKGCAQCADACEVDAISKDPEPSWEPACKSNNTGALKWYVDSEKCYEFWCDNGTDCSTCISVCPYNIGSNAGEDRIIQRKIETK